MKKMVLLFCILVGVSITTSCVWFPQDGSLKSKVKTTISPFSTVNAPIVVPLKLVEDFGLYGNEDFAHTSSFVGNVLVVYDWENNNVVDYIYTPEIFLSTESVLPMVKDNQGYCNYYFSDYRQQRIYKLNSNTEVTTKLNPFFVFSTLYVESGMNFVNIPNGKNTFVYYRKDYDVDYGHTILGIRVLNPDTEELGSEIELETHSNLESIQDDKGDFWLMYSQELSDHKSEKTIIRKLDWENNKLLDPIIEFNNHEGAVYNIYTGWSESFYYELKACTSDYLIIEKNIYNQNSYKGKELLYLDCQTKDLKKIDLAVSENKESYNNYFVNINDTIYQFEYVYDDNECVISKYDDEHKKFEILKTFPKNNYVYLNTIQARENNIIIIGESGYDKIIRVFNCGDNSISDEAIISVNNLDFNKS